jgi:hypothetical protein
VERPHVPPSPQVSEVLLRVSRRSYCPMWSSFCGLPGPQDPQTSVVQGPAGTCITCTPSELTCTSLSVQQLLAGSNFSQLSPENVQPYMPLSCFNRLSRLAAWYQLSRFSIWGSLCWSSSFSHGPYFLSPVWTHSRRETEDPSNTLKSIRHIPSYYINYKEDTEF